MKKEIVEGARYCINTLENCFSCRLDDGECPCVVVFASAILEQHERYRWHDLRKNPDDLPAGEGYFDVCVLIKQNDAWGIEERYLYDTQYFCEQFQTKPTSISEVIAWREVELFEPEE